MDKSNTLSNATLLTATMLAAVGLACTAQPEPEPGDGVDPYALMQEVEAAAPVEVASLSVDELVDPGETCSLEARPAAIVSVLQRSGDEIRPLADDATVLYRSWSAERGWGEVREALCSNSACTLASIAHGRDGQYLIGAFGCGDHALTGVEVGRTADACHVDTAYVPIVLDDIEPACQTESYVDLDDDATSFPAHPTDTILAHEECPLEPARPSVVALTGVQEGDILWPWTPGRIVSRHQSERDADPMSCVDPECTMYLDGWAQTGRFEITAEVCGQQLHETVEVEPTLDGCNVQTEWVSLAVDAEDCVTDGFEPTQ